MDLESEKRELGIALEALLEKADGLKLPLVAIYISHALDSLRERESGKQRPPTSVQ